MERLNWHLLATLSERSQVRAVGPAGSGARAPDEVRVDEVPLRPLSRFLGCGLWRVLRIARDWKPDIVLAGSGLTAPLAWLAARVAGARSVAYVHGLDVAVRHPVYRCIWLPAMRRMSRLIANSQATAALAAQAGIDSRRVGIVHPGVDIPESSTLHVSDVDIRHELGVGSRPMLISVGRLTRRKGLREFVSEVLPSIAAKVPDVVLMVVGDVPGQALHAQGQTIESIREAAEAAGVGMHLKFLGAVLDGERLRRVYAAADVHVFPVRQITGDPEGFGMVAVEAAAHGVPTVAYATGGVVDAVADGRSGRLVPPGDSAAFADSVVELLNPDARPMRESCRAFAQDFSWARFGSRVAVELGLVGE